MVLAVILCCWLFTSRIACFRECHKIHYELKKFDEDQPMDTAVNGIEFLNKDVVHEKHNDNNEKDESSSQAGNSWFWVPWLLPHVGGLVTLSLFHHRLYHPLFSSYHISSSSPIGCSRLIEDW